MQKRFAIGVALLCLGYYILEWYNGRAQMADFRVYYDAADALIHGETLYGKAFGVSSGFYKYSPFACIPFIPLAFLPYSVASFFYYIITTGAIIFFSIRLTNFLKDKEDVPSILLPLLSGFFLIDHLERELHLGNVNLLLLIALFETFIQLKNYRNWQGGIVYGIVLLFKPHFVLLLPYLFWKRRFSALASTAVSLLVGLFLPAVALGWEKNLTLLQQWTAAMSDHNVALQLSPNTLYGLINHLFFSGEAGSVLIILALTLVGIGFVWHMWVLDKRNGQKWSKEIRYTEYFLLVGLVPNLVHTDTEHFMWVWPLLALAIYDVMKTNTPWRKTRITLLALAFIPFALNSPDIVGSKIRLIFDEGGLGLANVIILVCALMTNYRLRVHP